MSNYAGLAEMGTPLWPGCRSVDGEWVGWLREGEVANLSWAALSHGFFSGRYSPEKRDQEDMVGAFYAEANWARLERAREYGEERGWSATQVALAWALNRDFKALAAFWVGNFDEFREGMAMAEVEMSAKDAAWLRDGERAGRD